MVSPYIDNENIRTFSKDVANEELVWHRDRSDRTITILEGEGWRFQRDNCMPICLSKGDKIHIPAYEYHRIFKGETDLRIEIKEN